MLVVFSTVRLLTFETVLFFFENIDVVDTQLTLELIFVLSTEASYVFAQGILIKYIIHPLLIIAFFYYLTHVRRSAWVVWRQSWGTWIYILFFFFVHSMHFISSIPPKFWILQLVLLGCVHFKVHGKEECRSSTVFTYKVEVAAVNFGYLAG